MNSPRIAVILPLAAALVFFVLAFSRPQQRGVWLAIGVVFLVVGVLRWRKGKPPSERPGA
jgi:hypothetical protein